ncbi:hypothetical protein AGR6A_Lc20008 [Agrobacterium sp. NCPPB 925]|nr:hypothetical protein AGR6A_Lc20008 [Agrobacterium sp. NCPPB 925]
MTTVIARALNVRRLGRPTRLGTLRNEKEFGSWLGSLLQKDEKVREVELVDVIGNRSSFWARGYEALEVEASRNARPLVEKRRRSENVKPNWQILRQGS